MQKSNIYSAIHQKVIVGFLQFLNSLFMDLHCHPMMEYSPRMHGTLDSISSIMKKKKPVYIPLQHLKLHEPGKEFSIFIFNIMQKIPRTWCSEEYRRQLRKLTITICLRTRTETSTNAQKCCCLLVVVVCMLACVGVCAHMCTSFHVESQGLWLEASPSLPPNPVPPHPRPILPVLWASLL